MPRRPLSLRLLSSLSSVGLAFAITGCDAGSSASSSGDCKSPSCGETGRQNNSCSDGASIQLGKYRVLNNLWGMSHTGVVGSQCAWSTCGTESGISWGTEYNWAGGPAGQVTSYTAAILGWHFSTINPDSGLPVQLASRTNIDCSWSFKLDQTKASIQNVAYDIWLSPEANPVGNTRPTDEVMIWLFNSGGASPIGGSAVDTLSLPSGNFALSEGSNNGAWQVHSFVRTGTAECTDLNLNDFFDFLVQKRGLDAQKYVIGIEAGTEVFSGAGTLTTNHYSCDVR